MTHVIVIGVASNWFRTLLLCVMNKLHIPVLPTEVIDNINVLTDGTFADLTFGEGGHSELLLSKPIRKLVAYDRDLSTLSRYREAGQYKDDKRLELNHGCFSEFSHKYASEKFDGILIDLGVSTRQLLEPERGFSFQKSGPLDMRMNPDSDATLEDYLKGLSEEELANALYENTDMHESRRVARKLHLKFKEGKIQTTLDIAEMMGHKKIGMSHPATLLFLGLRMMVNQELNEIKTTLSSAFSLLKPKGRLVVITFHSTEDRFVKKIFAALAGRCICDEPICRCQKTVSAKMITRKPIPATEEEIRINPRSRSAKLRCIEKI